MVVFQDVKNKARDHVDSKQKEDLESQCRKDHCLNLKLETNKQKQEPTDHHPPAEPLQVAASKLAAPPRHKSINNLPREFDVAFRNLLEGRINNGFIPEFSTGLKCFLWDSEVF